MAKHTPGPWKTVSKPDYASYGGIGIEQNSGSKDENVICEIWPIQTVPTEDAESQANSRLIAAAPDLLAALKWVAESASRDNDEFGMWAAVDAAIAKAE